MTTPQHGNEAPVRSLGQILETLELQHRSPTTEQPSQDSKESLKKKRDWLDKWLKLKISHPQLAKAESQIYDFCSEFASNPSVGKTVVMFGSNGCGKSHILKAVMRWANAIKMRIPLVVDHDVSGQVSTAVNMLVIWAEIVDGFKPPRNDYQIIEDLTICTLLGIDDIGAEHDPSGIGVEKLYVMLNRREKRWNLVTTNIQPAAWRDKFESRVSSRLFRNAIHIDLSEVPDYNA